jgi:hypothetical protein
MEAFIISDRKKHPACMYSRCISSSCARSGATQTCETLRRVLRNCPGEDQVEVWSASESSTGENEWASRGDPLSSILSDDIFHPPSLPSILLHPWGGDDPAGEDEVDNSWPWSKRDKEGLMSSIPKFWSKKTAPQTGAPPPPVSKHGHIAPPHHFPRGGYTPGNTAPPPPGRGRGGKETHDSLFDASKFHWQVEEV